MVVSKKAPAKKTTFIKKNVKASKATITILFSFPL